MIDSIKSCFCMSSVEEQPPKPYPCLWKYIREVGALYKDDTVATTTKPLYTRVQELDDGEEELDTKIGEMIAVVCLVVGVLFVGTGMVVGIVPLVGFIVLGALITFAMRSCFSRKEELPGALNALYAGLSENSLRDDLKGRLQTKIDLEKKRWCGSWTKIKYERVLAELTPTNSCPPTKSDPAAE